MRTSSQYLELYELLRKGHSKEISMMALLNTVKTEVATDILARLKGKIVWDEDLAVLDAKWVASKIKSENRRQKTKNAGASIAGRR